MSRTILGFLFKKTCNKHFIAHHIAPYVVLGSIFYFLLSGQAPNSPAKNIVYHESVQEYVKTSTEQHDPLALMAEEVECLALNNYAEARGEGVVGMIAVTNVVMNRVNSPYFPNTACEVVYQKRQFSWTLSLPLQVLDADAYRQALEIAEMAVTGELPNLVGDADHYFNPKKVAKNKANMWFGDMQEIAKINNHLFLKEKPRT